METLSYQLDMLTKPTWTFVNAGAFARENLLYIQEAGHFCSGKKYYTRRRELESFLLQKTLSGGGILTYEHQNYAVRPGSVMLIDCRRDQYYRTDPAAGHWEADWVHFYGAKAEALYRRFVEQHHGPVAMLNEGEQVGALLEAVLQVAGQYAKDNNSDVLADSLLSRLLCDCLVSTGGSGAATPDGIRQVAGYLRHHYAEPVSLDTLAAAFHISKYHLQRQFTRAMGVSPGRYLTGVRMEHAKSLLRSTDCSVNEVAERIGMEPNYFIRVFKETEQLTPRRYRERWCGQ